MEIKNDLHQKSIELLDWLNENLAAPGRVRFMRGKGKSIILIFADASSPKSLQEYAEEKSFDLAQADLLAQTMLKARAALDCRDHKAAAAALDQVEELAKRIIKKSFEPDPSIRLVLKILAATGEFCEKWFHDPAMLKQLVSAINQLY
ncbi:MAG: hypothetical protein HC851_17335 [Acaryochloris sp. RU_4_1]|nr:hypothetical protein [Acaryochloris sp. RU_4_1]NJR55417.1 hypothetical protein [Acaryochloris sp. CRU_2_0]